MTIRMCLDACHSLVEFHDFLDKGPVVRELKLLL